MEVLTVIIPTHNRHHLILKNIEYYSSFENCNIHICDSSDKIFEYNFPNNVSYYYMPSKSFVEKMHVILTYVNALYVSVCADDDFIIESTTRTMVEHMKSDNYVMSVGRYVGFDIPFSYFYRIYNKDMPKNTSSIEKMLKGYLSNYHMSLWATYRTSEILKIYKMLSKSKFTNNNLIELVIAISCSVSGKILFLDRIYGVREVNNALSLNWAKSHKSILSAYCHRELRDDLRSLRLEFQKEFDPVFFDKGVGYYLKSSFLDIAIEKIRIFKTTKNKLRVDCNTELNEVSRMIHKYM